MKKLLSAAFCALCLLLTGCAGVAPPENVDASLDPDGAVQVSWSASEGAETFRIYRKTDQTPDYKYVCDVSEPLYVDREVESGVTYRYKVERMAQNRVSEGAESPEVAVPAAPTIRSVTVSEQNQVTVEWEGGANGACRVYGRAGGDWRLLGETDAGRFTFQNSSGCTSLAVSCAWGESTESAKSEPVPVLCQPTITSVTQMDPYTVVLMLKTDDSACRYEVLRADTADGPYTVISTTSEPVYYDETAQGGASYCYAVRAVTDVSTGALSAPAAIGTNAKNVFGVPVFMYHEFVTQKDLDSGVAFDEYAIWASEFERDLAWLRDNGYTTITTRQLVDYLNGKGTMPEKPVLLTIDDGKLGVYKHAYPLLKKYGMTASLSLIGTRIDLATQDPQGRADNPAPYCTWEEIREMALSGAVEMISHTYSLHVFHHDGRQGADCAANETMESFLPSAQKDYAKITGVIRDVTGTEPVAMAYPYSKRSEMADSAWLKSGYRLLLAGDSDSARRTRINYFVQDAGVNLKSAVVRRITRMRGTPIASYMEEALGAEA